MIPVILSGGSGTRLWPISRVHMPKQFCEIFDQPLQTMTLKRCAHLGTPWIVTGEGLRTLTEMNLKQNQMENVTVVYEPFGKNTAPAIAVLCKALSLKGKADETVGVFPSDHVISKEATFLTVVEFAKLLAEENRVVTLGIKPSYPETGYGYIQTQSQALRSVGAFQAFEVIQFHEKPAMPKAREFVEAGTYSWNAGIFIFKTSHMISLFQKHQPKLWSLVDTLKADFSNLADIYGQVENISIDYAIMEKLTGKELVCIPAEFGWNDVGSWDAVASLRKGQECLQVQCQSNVVFGLPDKSYSVVGADDLIVVDTADALLVVKKEQSQNVKHVVDELKKKNSPLVTEHRYEYRPWGYFEILKDTPQFKSKIIRVNPHSQLSYQSHTQREEHWTITQGTGEVVLNDDIIQVKAGMHIHIPLGAKHRMRNNSDQMLEFVEVQLGTYFGEDDIIRYQDDYKRI